jgi:hypothetical protein
MAYENLLQKYDITREQLDKGIDIVAKNLSQISNMSVVLAIADLLATGDVKGSKENG